MAMNALMLSTLLAVAAAQFSTDPCHPANHNELNDVKRSTGFVTAYPETPLCDIHLPAGWYRFTSPAGGEMPTSCVQRLKCGTVVPIWLNGTHPSVADGVVARTACGNFESGNGGPHCCEHSVTIGVKNCGQYYIYYLRPPPSCPVAYCAGDKPPCPVGKWSTTGFMPCKDAYPMIKTQPKLTGPHIHNKAFDFRCTVDWAPTDPTQRFEVVWTFDGKEDPNVLPTILSDPHRVAILDGRKLIHNMNKNVGCQVRAYYDGNPGHKSGFLKSNTYYAGIQVTPGHLVVDESAYEKNITVTSTIPIICDHSLECCLTLKVDVDASTDVNIRTMCDFKLCSTDWDQSKHQASIQIPVLANKDMVRDGNKRHMIAFDSVLPSGGGDFLDVFTQLKIPDVPTETKDSDCTTCSLTGDPHINGVEHVGTYHLFKTGDYTAMEVPGRDFQVQIRTWPCNGGRVSCICGVTIRERNDLIRVNMCDQPYRGAHTTPVLDIANKLSRGAVIKRSRDGHRIGVHLSSGSDIRIDATSYYMNVFITSPGIDKAQTRGICGTNDGNKQNEFMHPDGTVDKPCTGRCVPESFTESWRASPRNSLFETVPRTLRSQDSYDFCKCRDNHHGHAAVDCAARGNVATRPTVCAGCTTLKSNALPPVLTAGHGWSKRSAAAYLDVDMPDVPYVRKDLPSVDPNKSWPNDQGLSESRVHLLCDRALRSSPLYGKCSQTLYDDSIEGCMADILFGNSTEFLNAAKHAYTAECQLDLSRDPASYVTNSNGENVMKPELLDDICPPECEEHGHCGTHGKCVCDHGWEGKVCHLMVNKGPQMDRIRSGATCDVAQRPCERIYVDVHNMDLSEELSCLVQPVDEHGHNAGKSVTTTAYYLSGKRLACELPKTTTASQRYLISATNDGLVFGNTIQLVVFNSACLDCTATKCTQKNTACTINNVCYRNGTANPHSSSQLCDIGFATDKWATATLLKPTISGPDNDLMLTCTFNIPDGANDVKVTWENNGKEVKSEVVTGSNTSLFSVLNAHTPAKLVCKVEANGKVELSKEAVIL